MDRSELLDQLADAERDLAERERQLARQRDVLRVLRKGLHETADAEVLLIDFRSTQALSIRNLAHLRTQLEKLPE